jgi:hypothetical protein
MAEQLDFNFDSGKKRRDKSADVVLPVPVDRGWVMSPLASDFGDPSDLESHRKLRQWVEQNWR